MRIDLAVQDLVDTLNSSKVLDKVESVRPTAGRPNLHLGIALGTQTQTAHYGLTKYSQGLTLTLTIKTALHPSTISHIIKEIDKEIVKDRRRSLLAQTTILDEAGWTPEEPDGAAEHIITRSVEVQVNDYDT